LAPPARTGGRSRRAERPDFRVDGAGARAGRRRGGAGSLGDAPKARVCACWSRWAELPTASRLARAPLRAIRRARRMRPATRRAECSARAKQHRPSDPRLSSLPSGARPRALRREQRQGREVGGGSTPRAPHRPQRRRRRDDHPVVGGARRQDPCPLPPPKARLKMVKW